MRGRQRVGDLRGVVERTGRVQRPPGNHLVERRAVDILERDEIDRVNRADLIDRDDVRVVEGGGRLGFADKPPRAIRVARGVGLQHFEGDHPIQPGIECPVDHPHAAPAEQLEDAVMTELRSDHGGRNLARPTDRNS